MSVDEHRPAAAAGTWTFWRRRARAAVARIRPRPGAAADEPQAAPDMMGLFRETEDRIRLAFPGVTPTSDGAEHLNELLNVEVVYMRRRAKIDLWQRVGNVVLTFAASVSLLVGSTVVAQWIPFL